MFEGSRRLESILPLSRGSARRTVPFLRLRLGSVDGHPAEESVGVCWSQYYPSEANAIFARDRIVIHSKDWNVLVEEFTRLGEEHFG